MRKPFVILALFLIPPTLADAGLRAQCRRLCGSTVSDCVVTTAQRRRACKRQTLRRCRNEGLQVCGIFPPTTLPPTTTLPPSTTLPPPPTTTTTLPPIPSRTVSGTISDDACDQLFDAANVTFTISPSTGAITFQLEALNPEYFFCWSSQLAFLQGSRQIGVSDFQSAGDALLTLDNSADSCTMYLPGAIITGTISNFPTSFDLAGPFTMHFNHTFCEPQWCGICQLSAP